MNIKPLTTTQDRPDYIRQLLLSGVLAMVIVLCFKSGVTGTFIFDDLDAIVNNDTIHSTSLWQILKTKQDIPPAARPLTNLSYAIDYRLYGLNPMPYIWTNIALQVIIAWCLFATLRLLLPILLSPSSITQAMTDWLAMVLTLLWAIHPVQTECVLYITQRSEQFAMLGMVLAFYGLLRHHHACEHSAITSGGWLVFSSLACIISMFFKQNATVLPVILLLFDRAILSGNFKLAFARRWHYFLWTAMGTWVVTTYVLIFDPNPACTGTGFGVSRWEYLMTQSQVILYYLRNIFWPTELCLYLDWPIVRDFTQVLPEFLAVGGLFVLGCICLWKLPKIGLAIVSIYLMLGPTSSLIPLVTEVAADRRMSLMMVFVVYPVAVLLYKLLTNIPMFKQQAATLMIGLVLLCDIVLMVTLTIPISVAYGNPVLLWKHTIKQTDRPQSAWDQLGAIYDRQNQLAPAWQCFQNALKLEPGFNIARLNLGIVEMKLGHTDEAIRYFEHESNNPYHGGDAWQYLGILYKEKRDYDQAQRCFENACKRDPGRQDFALNLARVYNLKKQYQLALNTLIPLADKPGAFIEMNNEMGFAYSNLGLLKEAQQAYQRYLKVVPDDAKVLNSMGVVMAKQGKLTEAAAYFARAVSIDPQLEEARDNLQKARQQIN